MRNSRLVQSFALSMMALSFGSVSAQSPVSNSVSNCSIVLVREDSKPISRNNHPVTYRVINGSDRGIRTIVYVGIPGATHAETFFSDYLEPGIEQILTTGNARWKGVDNESKAAVDLVLYSDGATCGPDTAGKSPWVTGVFEGQKAAIRSLRALIDTDPDVATVSAWLRAAKVSDTPDGIDRSDDLEWRKGYSWGYKDSVRPMAESFDKRGVAGVKSRIQSLEESLGRSEIALKSRN